MARSPKASPISDKRKPASNLPDRIRISMPENDPRFAGLRQELAPLYTGAKSPVPRMLGEYAWLGWLLAHGKLGGGGAIDLGELAIGTVEEQTETRQAIADAAEGFKFD